MIAQLVMADHEVLVDDTPAFGFPHILRSLFSLHSAEWFHHTFSEKTAVTFDELSDDLITAYVETGEPMYVGLFCAVTLFSENEGLL